MKVRQLITKLLDRTVNLEVAEVRVRLIRRNEYGAVRKSKTIPISYVAQVDTVEIVLSVEESDIEKAEWEKL